MIDIAQKHIFFKNYQSWIWIRIWWWNFRIRQKGPDPTGSGSATLPAGEGHDMEGICRQCCGSGSAWISKCY